MMFIYFSKSFSTSLLSFDFDGSAYLYLVPNQITLKHIYMIYQVVEKVNFPDELLLLQKHQISV